MKRKRRNHSSEFKAQVALEAVRGVKTVNEIAAQYEVHPVQVSTWKKDLLDRLPEVFGRPTNPNGEHDQKRTEQLERKVGQLTMEVDWLKKKCKQLHLPIDDKP
jgi:transposase